MVTGGERFGGRLKTKQKCKYTAGEISFREVDVERLERQLSRETELRNTIEQYTHKDNIKIITLTLRGWRCFYC